MNFGNLLEQLAPGDFSAEFASAFRTLAIDEQVSTVLLICQVCIFYYVNPIDVGVLLLSRRIPSVSKLSPFVSL
jgi:hypothetical protein